MPNNAKPTKPPWSLYFDFSSFPANPKSWHICRDLQEAAVAIHILGGPTRVSFGDGGLILAKHLIGADIAWNILPPNFSFTCHGTTLHEMQQIRDILNPYLAFRRKGTQP